MQNNKINIKGVVIDLSSDAIVAVFSIDDLVSLDIFCHLSDDDADSAYEELYNVIIDSRD